MSIDLFQLGVMLKNLQQGCTVVHDLLVESEVPSAFVELLKNAKQCLDIAAEYYLNALKSFEKSISVCKPCKNPES